MVSDYIRDHRPHVARARQAYLQLEPGKALRYAGLLRVPRGGVDVTRTLLPAHWKRHPHFHRGWLYDQQSIRAFSQFAAELKRSQQFIGDASRCPDAFEVVLAHVEQIVGKIKGLGLLAAYDATELVGYRFGFEPTEVFLHAGTRAGAERLLAGCNLGNVSRLPLSAFRQFPVNELTAAELEDFLCINASSLPGPDSGATVTTSN